MTFCWSALAVAETKPVSIAFTAQEAKAARISTWTDAISVFVTSAPVQQIGANFTKQRLRVGKGDPLPSFDTACRKIVPWNNTAQ